MDKNKYYSQFLPSKVERSKYSSLEEIIPTFVSETSTSENVQNLSNKNYISKPDSKCVFTLNNSKTKLPVLLTVTQPSTSLKCSQLFGSYKKNEEKNQHQNTNDINNTIVDDDFFSCLPKRRRSGNIVQSDLAENCQHEHFNLFNSTGHCIQCGKIMSYLSPVEIQERFNQAFGSLSSTDEYVANNINCSSKISPSLENDNKIHIKKNLVDNDDDENNKRKRKLIQN